MRVAVLADVHGNLPALEAVLADVEAAGVDRIVLPGDIALGPMPGETLDLLASLGDRVVWVHGNCERELVSAYDGAVVPGPERRERAGQRSPAGAAASRPDRRSADDRGARTSTVLDRRCSATRRRAATTSWCWSTAPVALVERRLAGVEEGVVVCGHTHMPFDRLVDGRRVVNPGSVGMAYGPPGAYWAVLGPHVELRRTAYDVAAAARADRGERSCAGAGLGAGVRARSRTGDAEALEVFSALVDRDPLAP